MRVCRRVDFFFFTYENARGCVRLLHDMKLGTRVNFVKDFNARRSTLSDASMYKNQLIINF